MLFVVTLAAYTSLGRLVTSNLGQYRETLVRELNAKLSIAVEVDSLSGTWSSFTPRIEFAGIRVLGAAHAEYALEMDLLVAEIDVLNSIRRRSIQFFVLQGSGVVVHAEMSDDGQLSLPGIAIEPGGNLGSPALDLLFNAELMAFDDVTINLHDDDGIRQLFSESRLQSDGDFRRFTMSLLSPSREAWFRMVGEGSGLWSDMEQFSGRLHFSTSLGDVANYNAWFSSLGLQAGRGGLDAQLWLEMGEGQVDVAAEVNARELQFQLPGGSQQQLELSGLDGVIQATNVDGVWNFDLNDLAISHSDRALQLDRLTGLYDGRALVLRSEDVAVEDIVEYLVEDPALPEAANDVLTALSPRGQFERLQLKLSDLGDLGRWRLEGNFRELGIDSLRGAPGIENAAGFVSLTRNFGRVQLASSDFTMDFPTVYREPLDYSEFSAELAWELRPDALLVRSGPFDGVGDEGRAHGLFSLIVPLQKTPAGVEMELMVGLADTDTNVRVKYLPYTLSEKLLNWLRPSIGGGRIVEGGFLWRGSLKQPQHRTVQLFFDIEAAALDYHPQWPGLTELDGLVVIADTDVDVYAQRARLLDSQATDLSVTLRSAPNKNLLLNVSGQIEGDASDGLAVVNNSPLRDIVGDTFADWQLQGALGTHLQLKLNLSDSSQAPVVRVNTDWRGVQLDAVPLNLQVDAVTGQLDFNTETGFSASGIKAVLWGQQLSADVSQGREGKRLAELDIAAQGVVRTLDLQAWLQQDVLALASGEAEAQIHIRVPPGGGAYLQARSQLQGVALDLPPPWTKAASESRSLNLQFPLTGERRRLLVDVDESLYLGVQFDSEGYLGASLGFRRAMAAEEPGYFLLGGEVDRLEWTDWSSFIDRHVLTTDQAQTQSREITAGLIGVRDLTVGELLAYGQRFENVNMDAQQLADSWAVQVHTDWLRGKAELPDDFSRVDITLEKLDVSGLSQGLESRLDSLNPTEFSLPLLSVNILELRNGENLWGNVSFDLRDEAQNYYFDNIRGSLRGLELGDEQAGMQLRWLGDASGAKTELSGNLGFTDFGQVLSQYNYDPIIETESGAIALALEWPGSPGEFSLSHTSGHMDIDVGEGRFLKTSGAAEGTLRVVSILNLADFVRRLSLDISYMFESGIPFHSIGGDLQLDDGAIEVPGLAVTGPSSQFQFVGRVDVPQERIDGELVATLPIATNLPWMAALISGLPAAAAVYVISKLFTKQMDRFSSASYKVDGSWNDPSVTFQRIFDNSVEQKKVTGDTTADAKGADPSQ